MTQYLYVKIHNDTGMCYLGKTQQNPFKYRGSGIKWRDHLKKHGYNISTIILYETENVNHLKRAGIFFSHVFNVVESDQWANLMLEEGQGGTTTKGMIHSKESRKKMSKRMAGHKNPRYGIPVSAETRAKIGATKRTACVYKGKEYESIKAACEASNLTRSLIEKEPTFHRL